MTLSIEATRKALQGKTPAEIMQWLIEQGEQARIEKANDPNLPEAEREKYRTAIALAGQPHTDRDGDGGTSESKGHVMPWNEK